MWTLLNTNTIPSCGFFLKPRPVKDKVRCLPSYFSIQKISVSFSLHTYFQIKRSIFLFSNVPFSSSLFIEIHCCLVNNTFIWKDYDFHGHSVCCPDIHYNSISSKISDIAFLLLLCIKYLKYLLQYYCCELHL